MNCLSCKSETSNPKYCSLSCSNKGNKKRSKNYSRIDYCVHCKKVFHLKDSRQKFCSRSCSATVNNNITPKRRSGPKPPCLSCGTSLYKKSSKKYCNNICKGKYEFDIYISRWLQGLENGLNGDSVSSRVKKYIIEQRGNKCEWCSWNKINPFTNKIPIQIDHIDGDWQNNNINNLRLLCPSCHSLTNTYGGRNAGKGRPSREKWRANLRNSSPHDVAITYDSSKVGSPV